MAKIDSERHICDDFPPHYINLSSVGNLKRRDKEKQGKLFGDEGFTDVKQDFVFKSLVSGKGWIYPRREGGNSENLKKGGRTELQRSNLTPYAKRTIRNAGNVISYLIENDIRFISSLMMTLTYGRAVPDHKTAKKHLNAFLTLCRKHGWLSHYVWVAQLQTGERAKQKGLKSYRAEHGSAIHFHVLFMTERGSDLQLLNAQRVLRAMWVKIVNDWEVKAGHKKQNIGGVDITPVYNASNYVSRYISAEENTIIGNMWGMSQDMRAAIQPRVEHRSVPICDFENVAKSVNIKRMYRTNVEGKQERIREASHQTISVKLKHDNSYVICTNDIDTIKKELNRLKNNRHRIKLKNESEELYLL